MNCQILDLVEAVLSALALSQTAWHDWSPTLARVKLTKMIEMDTVQNASSCNRHRVEVWMLILALSTLRLIFWRFVEWIASLLDLSDAVNWRNSQKNAPVLGRSDYAHFFRNLFRVERVIESEIWAPSARAFNEREILVSTEAAQEGRSNYLPIPILKCELVEQSTSLSQDGNEDQIAFGCELIAQSTLISRGDSGGGSVCDDVRHGSGVGNDCRDGGDDSGGQCRRISSDGDSNGGSGDLKDSDGFNDDRGFAGICNSESVSDYNGVVWHHVNAVKGAAGGGSNSGGVGDIDSGRGVVADSNGVEADGSDETCDAAGEAVVKGIVVGGSNDADDVDACGNANVGEACDDADDVEACDDADDGDEFDDANSDFDDNEYVGAVRDSGDGSGSADDASESTRKHTVEGANLIMLLQAWEIKELRMRIWRMTSYVKQLKKVNNGIVVRLKVAQSELRRLRKAECDLQRIKSTTVIKNNLRMVKDLVTEKIGLEVSRQAEGQRLAVEQVDAENCLAAGEC